MTASFLQASWFTSVLAFGLAVLAFVMGILLILIGMALRSIASVTRDNLGRERPGGSDPAEATQGGSAHGDSSGPPLRSQARIATPHRRSPAHRHESARTGA
jgi:hypothetical protein